MPRKGVAKKRLILAPRGDYIARADVVVSRPRDTSPITPVEWRLIEAAMNSPRPISMSLRGNAYGHVSRLVSLPASVPEEIVVVGGNVIASAGVPAQAARPCDVDAKLREVD